MEQVVIDYFNVPDEAKDEFLQATRRVQSFLKTLPGYVDGYLYEKVAGQSPYNIMTTATWESAEAIENTKKAVQAEFQRLGFNPQEMIQRLGIEAMRSMYGRQPY